MTRPLYIVLRCGPAWVPKARYVLDTLLMARNVPVIYGTEPPAEGVWLLYGPAEAVSAPDGRCVFIAHFPEAWSLPETVESAGRQIGTVGDLTVISAQQAEVAAGVPFDLLANAFFFLSSWLERAGGDRRQTRGLFANSIYATHDVPQDVVDRYLDRLMQSLESACARAGQPTWPARAWTSGKGYAIVLSHDVDFIPGGFFDTAKQGAKTVLRHLLKERDVVDAAKAAAGCASAMLLGRDAYGCVPQMIAEEKRRGVRASYQVAVGHRHPYDVNYFVERDTVQSYLRTIPDEGFELNLHGSYRSTENPEWYVEEAGILTRVLGRPLGSRQHFLSFDYDSLFSAQEQAGIEYDMSLGFPDRAGPRAGFSYPYFPYSLKDDRPYNVVQLSLFLMDVTLRSYMGLKGERAWRAIEEELRRVQRKGGCVSVVWHPIVFGGARDPGYDRLFWRLVEQVQHTEGLATDGRTVNQMWRAEARSYPSFC